MDPVATYAATAAVIAALIVFSTLVLFGVWLVRVLNLPQDLPTELHFDAPPPPLRVSADRADAAVVAARQARLREIHRRALTAARQAEAIRELAAQAQDPTLAERLGAAAERARAAATAADAARKTEIDAADADTARHLAEAESSWSDAQALARGLPAPSSRRLWLLLALAVLALAWLAVIIALRHAPGTLPVTG